MKKEYILQHKDHDVMLFDMDNENFKILDIHEIINNERLPFGLSDKDNMTQCAIQLDAWIKGRGLSGSRKDLVNIKNLFNVKDTTALTVKSLGLNLTDHFWLHVTNETLSWKNVNYFNNEKLSGERIGRVVGIVKQRIDEFENVIQKTRM